MQYFYLKTPETFDLAAKSKNYVFTFGFRFILTGHPHSIFYKAGTIWSWSSCCPYSNSDYNLHREAVCLLIY